MRRVLLLFEHRENRRLLAEWLAPDYEVLQIDRPARPAGFSAPALDLPFDLGIVDGPALEHARDEVQLRRAAERPALLPFLLLTSRHELRLASHHLWQSIDDLIVSPVEKLELRARVESLLRARDLSLQLKLRNDDLEAFVQAMTHDLSAPARIAAGFADALLNEEAGLSDQARHDLGRICDAAAQMRGLVAALLGFFRLGREGIRLQAVPLAPFVAACLAGLQEQIAASGGEVRVELQGELEGELPAVQADPTLLHVILSNLVSNALKFVPPGVPPRVTVSARASGSFQRVEVQDNGVGIAPGQQERVFAPFVRLFGVEEYEGTGLGLPAVRKAAELMGGRVGLSSALGSGSTFWVELPAARIETG